MFKDNKGNEVNPDEAVVAIIAFDQETRQFEILGTGFFIHGHGLIITAKHVVVNFNGERLRELYVVETNKTLERKVRIVITSYLSPSFDIALLTTGNYKDPMTGEETRPEIVTSFHYSLVQPNEGDNVNTYAFPSSKQIDNGDQTKMTFKGKWSSGKFVEVKPGCAKLNYECFELQMEINSGASGGPILNKNVVIAINSVSYDPFGDEPGITYGTPIKHIRDIKLPPDIENLLFQ